MVLTTVIILILVGCFINGRRRGLLMMILYAATYLVSWLVAKMAAPLVGSWLANLLPNVTNGSSYSGQLLATVNLDHFFSNGVAFMLIFAIVAFLCHWLIRQLNWVRRLPIIGMLDKLAGGVLSLLIGYVILFVILVVMQLWPAEWWQMEIANSGLARFIIDQTPILAQLVLQTIE